MYFRAVRLGFLGRQGFECGSHGLSDVAVLSICVCCEVWVLTREFRRIEVVVLGADVCFGVLFPEILQKPSWWRFNSWTAWLLARNLPRSEVEVSWQQGCAYWTINI